VSSNFNVVLFATYDTPEFFCLGTFLQVLLFTSTGPVVTKEIKHLLGQFYFVVVGSFTLPDVGSFQLRSEDCE
jgi:hypothetical protein